MRKFFARVPRLAMLIAVMGMYAYLESVEIAHLRSIHEEVRHVNFVMYDNLEMSVRVHHFTKPHKHHMLFCPECAEVLEAMKKTRQQELDLCPDNAHNVH